MSAGVLLLAACTAPRAERAQREPDSPERPAPSPMAQERERCTRENPCTLEVVETARRRVELEAETEAKIADASTNPRTKAVADRWMQDLARSIAQERDRFSDWCDTVHGWSADRRKAGAPGLTSDDVLKRTGEPTREMRPESRDGGTENRAWTWDVEGPLSRTVSFAILFQRPAGSDGPWLFAGCQWCASGGPATSPGCVQLPVKR